MKDTKPILPADVVQGRGKTQGTPISRVRYNSRLHRRWSPAAHVAMRSCISGPSLALSVKYPKLRIRGPDVKHVIEP
jgi:hypothetical protein